MRRGNLEACAPTLDGERTSPQAKPDFKLTIEDMLADDFDPTELRALFGEEHCKNISRLLHEAGVHVTTIAQLRARRQQSSRPISKTA